jgi:transcriptional regulator with XRE-family HTH domain
MKQIRTVTDTSLFNKIQEETPVEEKIFISRSLDIAHQITTILEREKILQKDLASKLGKTEAEVSRWLCGFHNFTLKTIARIETVLGEPIITTPLQVFEESSAVINSLSISLKTKGESTILKRMPQDRTSHSISNRKSGLHPPKSAA